jgi:transposase
MAWTDLLPHYPQLLVHAIQEENHHLTITLVSTRQSGTCPTCQTCSQAGHGWFTRRVQSLPCSGRSVVFHIQARRFRCPNAQCPRRTFREDLSCIAARYQRRTNAATRLLQGVGVEVGGQAGVRLTKQMSLPTSRPTLLRWTKRLAPCPASAPQVVGVDDFAWKKGRRYGTILVDLETHRLLALLPNCEVETVAAWFRQHPSVLIVTRDRSQAFAEAIRLGAPQALQVADRFHLHVNATECLEAILTREQATLRQVVTALRAQACVALPPVQPHVPVKQQLSQQRRTRRHICYEEVVQLAGQGQSRSAIARELGLHRDTVARYLNAGRFPERAPRAPRPKATQVYLAYLQQRWAEGEQNGRLLFEELRAQGYPASLTLIYDAIRPWRKGRSPADPVTAIAKQWPYYTPRQTLWLLFKEEGERTEEEHCYVQAVLDNAGPIACAFASLQRFRQILTERDEMALGPWAGEAVASRIPELVKFVQGLYRDWKAVENALLFASSQGQTEGQVNRLKAIKRQGYGRASPALLQARLLGARDLYRN